ncbi:hypothetical protein EFR25_02990 [Limosilactobacillus fermentum]|nr:hypothetical protein [Limosilactobacillus fermentum]MCT3453826.1 hypothetical protein [Limosilactobacillus fermentum]MCT3458657.1 hypothetical protein [Limosilactobacillus fermentum]RDG17847.1 hypothetical protein DQM14_07890 [Limosilactobacillus fermentum]
MRRILGKMAPLVDFHDATTLLGDFTMVKSYTIDWEKTVVVYRGGHHQTVVVTNEGDALLVDSPLPTLLQHFCQDHCLSWAWHEPVKRIFYDRFTHKERLSEAYIMGLNKLIPYKDKNAPDAGYFMAHLLCDYQELAREQVMLIFEGGVRVKIRASASAVRRQLDRANKLAQIHLDVLDFMNREAGLYVNERLKNYERIRVSSETARTFTKYAMLESFKVSHQAAFDQQPTAHDIAEVERKMFKKSGALKK